jgi:hypothetical protein
VAPEHVSLTEERARVAALGWGPTLEGKLDLELEVGLVQADVAE